MLRINFIDSLFNIILIFLIIKTNLIKKLIKLSFLLITKKFIFLYNLN